MAVLVPEAAKDAGDRAIEAGQMIEPTPMIVPVPMITPSTVRKERSLCSRIVGARGR